MKISITDDDSFRRNQKHNTTSKKGQVGNDAKSLLLDYEGDPPTSTVAASTSNNANNGQATMQINKCNAEVRR